MEEILSKLRNRFPTLLQDVLRKINNYRLERMKTFTCLGLPEDIGCDAIQHGPPMGSIKVIKSPIFKKNIGPFHHCWADPNKWKKPPWNFESLSFLVLRSIQYFKYNF